MKYPRPWFENHISLDVPSSPPRESHQQGEKNVLKSILLHEARALERMIDVDFFNSICRERSSRGAGLGHDEVCGVWRGDMFCAPVTEAHEIKSGKKFSPVPRIVGAIAMCISLTSPAWRYCRIVATPPPSLTSLPFANPKRALVLHECLR